MEWILKRRERTTNTHSAGLPTYGGGTPIPSRVNLGSHLVYPSAWLVLLLVRRRRLKDLVLYGGTWKPRVDMLHSGPGFLGLNRLGREQCTWYYVPLRWLTVSWSFDPFSCSPQGTASYSGSWNWYEPTGQNTSWGSFELESYHTNVFNGVDKINPFPGTGG